MKYKVSKYVINMKEYVAKTKRTMKGRIIMIMKTMKEKRQK